MTYASIPVAGRVAVTRVPAVAAAVLLSLIASTAPATAPPALADPPAEPNPFLALVDAAARRLATADPVAAVKWVHGGSIEDPVRVRAVLDDVATRARRTDAAKDIGADTRAGTGADAEADAVTRVFTDQIHATEGIEYARFAQWKFDPGSAPTNAPDLAASRAAIDALDEEMVDDLAALSGARQDPQCPDQRDAAVDSVTAAHDLDALHRRALGAAVRSYCG